MPATTSGRFPSTRANFVDTSAAPSATRLTRSGSKSRQLRLFRGVPAGADGAGGVASTTSAIVRTSGLVASWRYSSDRSDAMYTLTPAPRVPREESDADDDGASGPKSSTWARPFAAAVTNRCVTVGQSSRVTTMRLTMAGTQSDVGRVRMSDPSAVENTGTPSARGSNVIPFAAQSATMAGTAGCRSGLWNGTDMGRKRVR